MKLHRMYVERTLGLRGAAVAGGGEYMVSAGSRRAAANDEAPYLAHYRINPAFWLLAMVAGLAMWTTIAVLS